MANQLSLFADYAFIHCKGCGAELRNLDDLRGHCDQTGTNHQVASADYMTLYRRSHEIVLA